ncbi:Uncharacterised protein [BD1-7 clade bacterium]|uniref:Lysozyme inhibitor LprI N-terminal domain-containing protein n=1 Tax=BD1-7 clade bacterium TaxID=2029982 RepID=A0A5S9QX04_9GAMM|nr:Uncharacterised protein [BD1-7 clade bacterium]
MKNSVFILLLFCLLSPSSSANDIDKPPIEMYPHYYQKCAELIEMHKSLAANWTTSKLEAMAAGECLAAIQIIPDVATTYYERRHSIYSSRYDERYGRVNCNIGLLKIGKLALAQHIVDQKLETIDDIRVAFCE